MVEKGCAGPSSVREEDTNHVQLEFIAQQPGGPYINTMPADHMGSYQMSVGSTDRRAVTSSQNCASAAPAAGNQNSRADAERTGEPGPRQSPPGSPVTVVTGLAEILG